MAWEATVMIHFRIRRTLSIAIVGGMLVAFTMALSFIEASLGHTAIASGSALFFCILILILISLRKRLVMLPLGSVSTWTQIHIYTGVFSLGVYVLHVPRILANGFFEGGLSLLFLCVGISGLYGLYASRTAPRKLTNVPGEYRFDRIPLHRQQLADAALDVIQGLDDSLAAPVLAGFYKDSLHSFFNRGVPLDFLFIPNSLRRRQLLASLQNLDRYLSASAKVAAGQLAALIRTRDELDFHYAIQLRLRTWVAFHSSMSFLLLIWSICHIFFVIRFL